MRVTFIWPHEVTYSTGPISGPAKPGDEREVSDEDGQRLVESGFWMESDNYAQRVAAIQTDGLATHAESGDPFASPEEAAAGKAALRARKAAAKEAAKSEAQQDTQASEADKAEEVQSQ